MCLFTSYICFSVSPSKAQLLNQSLTPRGPPSTEIAHSHGGWDTAITIWHVSVYESTNQAIWCWTSTTLLSSVPEMSGGEKMQTCDRDRMVLHVQISEDTYAKVILSNRLTLACFGSNQPVTLSFACNLYGLAGVITTQPCLQQAYLSGADMDCLERSSRRLWALCKRGKRW